MAGRAILEVVERTALCTASSMKLYRDPTWLRERYWDDRLSIPQIGKLAGVSQVTIWYWMKKHNIPRRTLIAARNDGRQCNWRGGETVHSEGYRLRWKPDHHRADSKGYVYEHVLVMEEKLGRPLKDGEVCHHINGIKDDNRKENLMLFPSHTAHMAHHKAMKEGERS